MRAAWFHFGAHSVAMVIDANADDAQPWLRFFHGVEHNRVAVEDYFSLVVMAHVNPNSYGAFLAPVKSRSACQGCLFLGCGLANVRTVFLEASESRLDLHVPPLWF